MDREVKQILSCYPVSERLARLVRAFTGRRSKPSRFCEKCGFNLTAHVVDGACPPRVRAYQGDGIWIPSDDQRVRLEFECPRCQCTEYAKLSEVVEGGEPLCGICDRSMRYIGTEIKEPYSSDLLETGGNVSAALRLAESRCH